MEQNKETKEFYAFISYKREDERWARWLQHRLEHYRLPANLNGRTDLPKEIRPIFRDTSELLPGNLPQQINDALAASHHLIVICSPHSAQSVWVNKEIETFIAMGKQANIIPFIVDGHPFAQNPDEECFPVAIRNLPTEQELLGANVAEMGREAAAVKTVARMFGIRFDTLWGRYQREQRRRRNWIIAAVAAAFLFLLGIGAYIWKQNDDFRHAISRAAAKEAMQLIEEGDGYTAQRVALAALDKAYTPEAEAALRQAMQCRSVVLRVNDLGAYHARFSPDGKSVISYYIDIDETVDGVTRIWDVHTGQCMKIMKHWVFYSPDMKYMLLKYPSSLFNDSIFLCDATTEQCLWTKKATSSFFSRDGKSVVAITRDSIIHIWEVSSGRCIKEIKMPCNSLLSYSQDGKFIVCANRDEKYVYLVDIDSGRIIRTYNMSEDANVTTIQDIDISPDNKLMLLSTGNMNIIKFDIATGECLQIRKGRGLKPVFSPDGKYFAYSQGSDIFLTGEGHTSTFKGHTNQVESIAFSPDGKFIVSTSRDRTTRIWNLESKMFTPQTELNTDNINLRFVDKIHHSSDYKYIAFNGEIDTIRVWNAATGERLPSYYTQVVDGLFEFSHDNRNIVTACYDTTIRIYDIATGNCLRTLVGHTALPSAVVYSPDDRYIVSGANDSTIRIWDAATGQCLQTLRGHTQSISSVACSPDGSRIASISWNKLLRIWDAATGQCILTIEEFESNPYKVVYSPDGKRILITLANNSMLIYNMYTGEHFQTLEEHSGYIESASFSPDGRYVVSFASNDHIRIWDVMTGQCLVRSASKLSTGGAPAFNSEDRIIKFILVEDSGRFYPPPYVCNYHPFICTWDFPPLEELKEQVRSRFKDNPLTPEERRQYYLE